MVLLGGYPKGGGDVRNGECNKTILSGEIQQNNDSSDNSYHVVVTVNVDSTTLIDGFYIVDGNADGTAPNNAGGGWYNNGSGAGNVSNPTIRNCIISGNTALLGGGMYNNGSNSGTSSPHLLNTIFSGNNNNSVGNGGAMFNDGGFGVSSPKIINCIFSGNYSGGDGGAIYNNGGDGLSSPLIVNTVVSGNYAADAGGAIFNFGFQGTSAPDFVNSIFWKNNAFSQGPVFFNNEANPSVSYCIVQGTSTDLNDASISSSISGTTNNGGNNKYEVNGITEFFINAPLASSAPTTEGNFHIILTSPAINMGLNDFVQITTDLDGAPRINNGTVDIGAYEFQGPECYLFNSGIVYIDSSATSGANNGSSWTNAFTDLQNGLLAARLCDAVDTIKVAHGTYYPSDSVFIYDPCDILISAAPPDRSVSFDIPDSIKLIGAYFGVYAGAGPDSSSRDLKCNKTILCGDIQQDGDSSNNSYHVVTTINVDSITLIDGFCILDGNADGIFPNNSGGVRNIAGT